MKNNYSFIFHPKAEKEYLESVKWYENALTGLGKEFADEIENVITRIHENPYSFPVKKLKFREAIVKKFPYIVVFEINMKEKQIA